MGIETYRVDKTIDIKKSVWKNIESEFKDSLSRTQNKLKLNSRKVHAGRGVSFFFFKPQAPEMLANSQAAANSVSKTNLAKKDRSILPELS